MVMVRHAAPPPDAAPPQTHEAIIITEVRELLRNNPYLSLRQIDCEYSGGRLTLRGRVPSYFLKQLAQSTVARAGGVERVVNLIQVMPPGPAA